MNFKKSKEIVFADFSASIVVFFVALPLCMGIALASNAPLLSGLIAGIVGGLVVAIISGSSVSISGPAAGLTAVVIQAQIQLGSFELFLTSIFIAGICQIILGLLKAGKIKYLFPIAVIKGMLAAIGIMLISKQIPHALGTDAPNVSLGFFGINIPLNLTALALALICLLTLKIWNLKYIKSKKYAQFFPSALVAVFGAIFINYILLFLNTNWGLPEQLLVEIPKFENWKAFKEQIFTPDWDGLKSKKVYAAAITLALVASIETLLSIDAADRLDPYKRNTPPNRELFAQGVGNMVSGLFGGLPLSAVIVRSSANIDAGGKTKLSAILHAFWLFIAIVFLTEALSLIPLAALAGLLMFVGYQLANPKVFIAMYRLGWQQFTPFLATVVAILLTDLLIGMSIGFLIGLSFVIHGQNRSVFTLTITENRYKIHFKKDATFLTRASIIKQLNEIPNNSQLIVDISKIDYVDADIKATFNDYKKDVQNRNISFELIENVS